MDEEGSFSGPKFRPALFLQRYHRALHLLSRFDDLRHNATLIDFGCSEGKFLRHASRKLSEVSHFIGVDTDRSVLRKVASSELDIGLTDPNDSFTEFCYYRRPKQLRLSLYEGSLGTFDPRFLHVDFVTAIEVVEHLEPEDLERFPSVVFGQYRPRAVVVTTPNVEFNVNFPQLAGGGFRHPDHKFEWTRAEFGAWCEEVVRRYPEYSLRMDGLGFLTGDERCRDLTGPCTQIALFHVSDCRYRELREEKLNAKEDLGRPVVETSLVMRSSGDIAYCRRPKPPAGAREGEDGRYKAVYYREYDWDPSTRHYFSATRAALSQAARALAAHPPHEGRREGEWGLWLGGHWVPLHSLVRSHPVRRWLTEQSDIASFLGTHGQFGLRILQG